MADLSRPATSQAPLHNTNLCETRLRAQPLREEIDSSIRSGGVSRNSSIQAPKFDSRESVNALDRATTLYLSGLISSAIMITAEFGVR